VTCSGESAAPFDLLAADSIRQLTLRRPCFPTTLTCRVRGGLFAVGDFAGLYGLTRDFICPVRPDGHVGLISTARLPPAKGLRIGLRPPSLRSTSGLHERSGGSLHLFLELAEAFGQVHPVASKHLLDVAASASPGPHHDHGSYDQRSREQLSYAVSLPNQPDEDPCRNDEEGYIDGDIRATRGIHRLSRAKTRLQGLDKKVVRPRSLTGISQRYDLDGASSTSSKNRFSVYPFQQDFPARARGLTEDPWRESLALRQGNQAVGWPVRFHAD
jgi:hypothetical protein